MLCTIALVLLPFGDVASHNPSLLSQFAFTAAPLRKVCAHVRWILHVGDEFPMNFEGRAAYLNLFANPFCKPVANFRESPLLNLLKGLDRGLAKSAALPINRKRKIHSVIRRL
jgi:hypothetical protein